MKAIGIDIGASKILIGLVDSKGRISQMFKVETHNTKPEMLARLVKDLNASHIGIGVPGYRTARGIVAPNLAFDLESLLSLLKEYRLLVENDALLGAYALKRLFKMPDNFVYLAFGSGIGAGVYVDGRPLRGRYGNAHEVGHIVVDFRGRVECGCGGRGHWEAYCSGTGLPKFYSFVEGTVTGRSKSVDASYIFEAEDDEFASAILEDCAKINASGLATIVHLYDPELIVIGGGLALARWERFIEPSIRLLKEYLSFEAPKVLKTPLKEASMVGAALAVMDGGVS